MYAVLKTINLNQINTDTKPAHKQSTFAFFSTLSPSPKNAKEL
jgi:hypothetical protein